jgi:hypothetical protein
VLTIFPECSIIIIEREINNTNEREDKTMSTVICYRLHEPVIYNKGTKYEKVHYTFLHCYVSGKNARENAQAECDELNKTATDRVYYVSEQKDMY